MCSPKLVIRGVAHDDISLLLNVGFYTVEHSLRIVAFDEPDIERRGCRAWDNVACFCTDRAALEPFDVQ